MLRIEYIDNQIKVFVDAASQLFDMPLNLSVTHHVSKRKIWSCPLDDHNWATFPTNTLKDTHIYDRNGVLLTGRYWNVIIDGNSLYRTFYLYCGQVAKKHKPNGLVIGTNEGEIGEWIPAVINNITNAILVQEPEEGHDRIINVPNNEKLHRFYDLYQNTTIIDMYNITQDHQLDWLYVGSKKHNSLIKQFISEKLPPLIAFDDDSDVKNYLHDNGYYLQEGNITLAIKYNK